MARSNLYKDCRGKTRKTKTTHKDAVSLRFRDQNFQCASLGTSFRVFKLNLDNHLPKLSGADYQSHNPSRSRFKCIRGAHRGRTMQLESNDGRCYMTGIRKHQ